MRNPRAQIPQTALFHSSKSILQPTRPISVGIAGWLFWALAFEQCYLKQVVQDLNCSLLGLGFVGHPECDPNPSGDKIGPSPSNFCLEGLNMMGYFCQGLFMFVGFWVICPVTRALSLPSVEVTGGVRTDRRGFSAREASGQM